MSLLTRLKQGCHGDSLMREKGLEFVEMIKTLLQRLLEYRKIIQYESKEHRMSCIVNLLVSEELWVNTVQCFVFKVSNTCGCVTRDY